MRLRLVLLLLAVVTIVYANQTHKKKANHKTAVHHAAHHPARAVHHKAAHHAAHKRAATHKRKNVHKKTGGKKRAHKKGQKTIRGLRVRAHRRSEKTCSNLAMNCRGYIGFCGMAEFKSLMTKFCKLECGHCEASGNDCKDHHPQCKKFKKQGFCSTGSAFPKDLKRAFCAKTCGLCLDCNKNKFATDCLSQTCPKKANQSNSKCKAWCKKHKSACGTTPPKPTTPPTPTGSGSGSGSGRPAPGSGSGSGSGRPAPGSGSGSGSGRPTPGGGSGSGRPAPPGGSGSGSGAPPSGGGGGGGGPPAGSGSGSGARG
ncbi:hypothetical protein M3Y99_00915100 [Aphelenchoides fujianensis]|nr:hypothetical protein M3Y99_00915100 [Aphelenchoides fujianensis]